MIPIRWILPLGGPRYAAVCVTAVADAWLMPLRAGQEWLATYAETMQREVFG